MCVRKFVFLHQERMTDRQVMALLFGGAPGNVSNQRYFRKLAVAGVTPNPAPHKQTCCHGSSSPRASVPPRTLACPWELLPAHVSRGSCVRRQRGRISPDDPERRSRMGLIRLAHCDEQEMTSSSCDRIKTVKGHGFPERPALARQDYGRIFKAASSYTIR